MEVSFFQFLLSSFSSFWASPEENNKYKSNEDGYGYDVDIDVETMRELLFPNRSRRHILAPTQESRELSFDNAVYNASAPVPCVICQGLSSCSVLNGLMIQEVYTPKNLNLLTTCSVLEQVGDRVLGDVFGPGRIFRDTPSCISMVMQYSCLFWGSDNPMYTNFCVYQEDVSSANPALHKIAPRAPCRSFCTQIADVCAYDHVKFTQICSEIACPPTEDTCTPDPVLDGLSLSANLGCDLPYFTDPYAVKNSGSSLFSHHSSSGNNFMNSFVLVVVMTLLLCRQSIVRRFAV